MKIKCGKQGPSAIFIEDLRNAHAIGMNPETGQARLGFLPEQWIKK